MSHSSRASKRKLAAQEEEAHDATPGKRERLSSDDGSVSRTGRVRKKSSKILEMEQGIDDLEEAITGRKKKKGEEKASKTNLLQSGKKKKDLDASTSSIEAQDVLTSPQGAEEAELTPSRSTRKAKGRRAEKTSPSVSNVVQAEPDGSLKMTLQLGQLGTGGAGTRSAKKARGKQDSLSPLPPLEIPEHQDVTSVMDTTGSSGIKLKLILSPTKDKSTTAFSSPEPEATVDTSSKKKKKSESKRKRGKEKEGSGIEKVKIKDILAAQQMARDAKALEQQNLVQQSALAMHLTLPSPTAPSVPVIQASPLVLPYPIVASPPAPEDGKKKKKSKKKGKEQTIPEIAAEILSGIGVVGDEDSNSMSGNLEIDLTPKQELDTKKKKKEPKKPATKKSPKKKGAEMVLDALASGESPLIDVGDGNSTVYANTNMMALKLKTSREKKASKKTKSKKKDEDPKKPKKRRGPTAYMLWCNSYRNKVIAENPERDFAQISKRLGEIWQGLLEKEKLSWKRKAKKIAAKGSTLITTGKLAKKAGKMGLPAQSKITSTGAATVKATGEAGEKPSEVHATSAVDVAAHLKLLGESLSIIGNRLTESRGQIAVQGSLSVMLDSMLCALGPLSCLTAFVPETQAITDAQMAETLDNIAFIMPGL